MRFHGFTRPNRIALTSARALVRACGFQHVLDMCSPTVTGFSAIRSAILSFLRPRAGQSRHSRSLGVRGAGPRRRVSIYVRSLRNAAIAAG